jgi:hypothetical protein
MPLVKGKSREDIERNIAELIRAGHSPKQAEGIAYSEARDRRQAHDALALDRDTVRSKDEDGRLRVSVVNISKAMICPYRGNEIPGWQQLGLEGETVYHLFRDPVELQKAAATCNLLPLLITHVATSADAPQTEHIIGSTGSHGEFVAPYLQNSLVVWDGEAIELIEAKKQRQLSWGYHYEPDMTPGHFEGQHYDGAMRNLRGNHVALVVEGRAGPDVVVGDSQFIPKGSHMPKAALSRKAAHVLGALAAYLPFKLAADAALPDIKASLKTSVAHVNAVNFRENKPAIAAAVTVATRGKLAKDANIDDVVKLLDGLDDDDDDMTDGADAEEETDEEKLAREVREKEGRDKEAARDKRAADKAAKDKSAPGKTAEDDDDEDKVDVKQREPSANDKDEDDDMKDRPTKEAMDAAIRRTAQEVEQRTIARMQAIDAAIEFVQPWMGKVNRHAPAMDSAEAVYGAALRSIGVDTKGIDPKSFRQLLGAYPKTGAITTTKPSLAADSAAASGFASRFPKAAPITRI